MNKISRKRFNEILAEEIDAFIAKKSVNEDVDHASHAAVTSCASKLLGAVKGFEEKANDTMKNALVELMPSLKQHLENMVQTPGAYVPKAPRKIIKLRVQKDD